jgi:hypothetical protein
LDDALGSDRDNKLKILIKTMKTRVVFGVRTTILMVKRRVLGPFAKRINLDSGLSVERLSARKMGMNSKRTWLFTALILVVK